jgi:hypothetical protein
VNRDLVKHIHRSGSFYPITAFYLAAVCVTALAVRGVLTLNGGAVVLALVAILVVLAATWRELKIVHRMMDGQRTEMLARIDHMTELLTEHGIQPPPPLPAEIEARNNEANEAKRSAL